MTIKVLVMTEKEYDKIAGKLSNEVGVHSYENEFELRNRSEINDVATNIDNKLEDEEITQEEADFLFANMEALVEEVKDFSYSDYNEYICDKLDEKLEKFNREVSAK